MAKYPDLITTKKGLDLNSAANAAQKAVIFTKVYQRLDCRRGAENGT